MANTATTDGIYVSGLRSAEALKNLHDALWEDEVNSEEGKKWSPEERQQKHKEFVRDLEASVVQGRQRSAFLLNHNWHAVTAAAAKIRSTEEATQEQINAYQHIASSGFTNRLLGIFNQDATKLKTTQGGVELMNGVIANVEAINLTSSKEFAVFGDLNEERKAYLNIFDKQHKFIEYDLEGVGDYITQYAFSTVNMNIGTDYKQVKNAMVAGIIGLDKSVQDKLLAMIDEYDKIGDQKTGYKGLNWKEHGYKLDEMAKFGLGSWHMENGRAVLDAYASDEEIDAIRGDRVKYSEAVRKGIKELGDIYKQTTAHTVEFEGYQMYQHEADILKQLKLASKKNGGLTMVSTNAMSYDNRQIEAMFGYGGWASEGARAYFGMLTGGTGSLQHATNQLDMTSIGRGLVSNGFVLGKGAEAARAQLAGQKFNSSTGNSLAYLGIEGFEAAQKEVAGMLSAGQKHTAAADVIMQAITHIAMINNWATAGTKEKERINKRIRALNSSLNGPAQLIPEVTDNSIFVYAGRQHEIKQGATFFINNGQFSGKSAPFSFVQDGTSGEIRYAGHVRVGYDGKFRDDIVSHGPKKGTMAVVLADPVRLSFDSNNEDVQALLGVFQDTGAIMPGTELFAIKYGIIGDTGKTRNTYYQIGTKEQLRNYLQDNTYLGTFDRKMYAAQKKQEKQKALMGEQRKVIEDALAQNKQNIRNAYQKGLIPKYVLDAVERLDPDYIDVKAAFLIEKAQHQQQYLAKRASLIKDLGTAVTGSHISINDLNQHLNEVLDDDEVAFDKFLQARKAYAKKKDSGKDLKEEHDDTLELVKESRAEKKRLKKAVDALERKRKSLKSYMESVKPEKSLKELKLADGEEPPEEYKTYDALEIQYADLKNSLEDATIQYDTAKERYDKFLKAFEKKDKDYRQFKHELREKGNDITAGQEAVDTNAALLRSIIQEKSEMLQPLRQLDEDERAWQADYRKRLHQNGKVKIYQPTAVPVEDPTKDWTESQWEDAMRSVKGQAALDTSDVDQSVIDEYATVHHGKNGKEYYKYDTEALARRSETVITEETAGNWVRDMDYRKAGGILAIQRALGAFSRKFYGMDPFMLTVEQRNASIDFMLDAYKYGARAHGSLQGDQRKAYENLVGNIHRVMTNKSDAKYDRYPNFIRNFAMSTGWSTEMAPVLKIARRKAKELAGSNTAAQAFYFKEIYDNMLADLTQQANKVRKIAGSNLRDFGVNDAYGRQSWTLDMTRGEEDSFLLDLTPITAGGKMNRDANLGSKMGNPFAVKLNVGESFGARLATALGRDKTVQSDIMDSLHDLGVLIYRTYGQDDDEMRNALLGLGRPGGQPYSQDFLQALIVNKLRKIRRNDSEAGRITGIQLMDVNGAPLPIRYLKDSLGEAGFKQMAESRAEVIAKSPSITKFDNKKKTPRKLAGIVADRLFERTNNVTKEKLLELGYSDDVIGADGKIVQKGEATRILERRGRRYNDTIDFLEILFDNTYARNKHLTYRYTDEGTFKFELMNSEGDVLDITHLLPFDEFNEKTGQFETKVGGRNLATVQQFAHATKLSGEEGYAARSLVAVYARALEDQVRYFNSPKRSDKQNLKNIDFFTRQALDTIVDQSFTKFDEQDLRQSSYLNLMPFFKRLGMYASRGDYAEEDGVTPLPLAERTKELLQTLMERWRNQNERATGALLEEVKLSNTEISTIYSDLDRLLDPLKSWDSKLSKDVFGSNKEAWQQFKDNVLDHINTIGLRHPENGLVSLTESGLPFLAETGHDLRNMAQVMMRTHKLQNVDEVKKVIEHNSALKDITRFDSIVLTGEEAARRGVEATKGGIKSFRTVQLAMTHERLEQVLATRGAQDVMKKLGLASEQFYTFIGESGAIINPEFLDLFPRNIQQRERTDKVLDIGALDKMIGREASERQKEIDTQTRAVIKADENGNITFKYSDQDILIGRGDKFAWKESFAGLPDKQVAERTGFLKRRYYTTDGRELSPDEINKVLAGHQDHLREVAANDPVNLDNTINNILKGYGYTEKFAIESVDSLPYRKAGIDTEKVMAKFLTPALGQLDGSLNDKDVTSKIPTILGTTKEKIESVMPLFLSPNVYNSISRTNAVLADAGLHTLDEAGYDKFVNAIKEDRARTWEGFEKVLVAGGALKEGQHVGLVSEAEIEAVKPGHMEVMKAQGKINEAVTFLATAKAKKDGRDVASDKDFAEASEQIRADFDSHKVFTDANGRSVIGSKVGNEAFSVGNVTVFDEGGFNQIMAKYHPDYAPKGDKAAATRIEVGKDGDFGHAIIDGTDIGALYHYNRHDKDGNLLEESKWTIDQKLGIAEVRSIDDADEGRYNSGGKGGIKVSRRMLVAAGEDTIDMPGLQKVMESMERFEKSIGREKYDAEAQFNKEYQGIASVRRGKDGKLTMTMEEGAENSKVNASIIQNMKEEVVAGTRPHLQFGRGRDAQLYSELAGTGIGMDAAKTIVEGYNKRGYEVVGMDTVKHEYAYASGKAAIAFNNEMSKATTAQQRQEIVDYYTKSGLLGSHVIDISKAEFDTRADSALNENNITERGAILQIGDQLVAVGYQPSSVMDNENGTGRESTSGTRDLARKIQSQYGILTSNSKDSAISEGGIQDAMSQTIEDMKSMVVQETGSKKGAIENLTSGYLPNSGMFKGGILRTENGASFDDLIQFQDKSKPLKEQLKTRVSANELLKSYEVDGSSLADHIAAGHRVNAVFVGKDYFENMVKGEDFRDTFAKIKGYKSADQITKEDEKEAVGQLIAAAQKGSIGIGLRQPMEYEGSVQAMHIFYNSNIASNEMIMTESAAAAMKLDKDGDIAYANAMREQANVYINGDSKVALYKGRISGIEASALTALAEQNNKSIDIQFKNNGSLMDAAKGAADISANATQTGIARSDEGKDMEKAVHEGHVHKDINIGGNLYSVAGTTREQRINAVTEYENIVKSDGFQSFVDDYIGKMDEKDRLTDDQVDNIHKAGQKSALDLNDAGITNAFLAEYRKGHTEAEAQHLQGVFGLTTAIDANAETIRLNALKKDAGLNNMNVFRLKDITSDMVDQGVTNFQAGDHHIIAHIGEHLNDAYQATKNSTSTDMFSMQKMNNAIADFFGANEQRVRNTQPFMDMLKYMYDNGGIKELAKLPTQEGIEPGEDGMISFDRIKQAFDHVLPENKVLNAAWYEEHRVGYAQSPVEPKLAKGEGADPKSDADAIANELLPERAKLHEDVPLLVDANSAFTGRYYGDDEKVSRDAVNDLSGDIDDIVRGTFRTLGAALNHGGAKAMLGFAGAMMMAGTMAGAPTSPTPAQGQAKGIQSENAIYEMPSAVPSATTRSQPQSYIINVNASTSRGRDFATTAINQAMASMQQTSNGNQMTMNIKDSSSNIGFGDIANYVSGML